MHECLCLYIDRQTLIALPTFGLRMWSFHFSMARKFCHMFVTVYAVCLYLEGNLRQIYPLYIGEKAASMYGADYACNVLLSHLELFLVVCSAHMENLSRTFFLFPSAVTGHKDLWARQFYDSIPQRDEIFYIKV